MNEEGALLVPAAIAGKSALMKLELNGNTFDAEGRACAAIQDALAKMDKGEGVLDELDDMEEPTDDEEEEEEEEEEVEEEEDDEKDTKKSTTTTTTTTTTSSAADDLADLMTSKLNV